MNALTKSIFIVAFPAFALVAMTDSLWHIYKSGISLQHIAHLLPAATIVFFFSRIFIKPIARTDRVLKPYTFIIFLGFILGLLTGTLKEGENLRVICSIFNSILTICWVLYLVWYSHYQERSTNQNTILRVGNMLPLLSFENANKLIITTEHFAGTPSIFIFYRGNWCPFCMAQIKEMVEHHEELTDRNINTVFISSQPHSFTNNLTEKHPLDFQFLVDVDGKVAKQLDIFAENGLPFGFQLFGFKPDTILPTIIITNSDEKIVYTNQTDNYRVRPEPSELLRVIDANV